MAALLALLLASPAFPEPAALAEIAAWDRDIDARVAAVERHCLNSPALAGRRCIDGGEYRLGERSFQYAESSAFDQAEHLIGAAQAYRGGRQLAAMKADDWGQVLRTARAGILGSEQDRRADPPTANYEVLKRGRQRYEALRAKAAEKGKGLATDDERLALAACFSARGFTGYNQAEADAVRGGTSDSLASARYPWESFVTNRLPRHRGRGVCRDYAAIARDVLRAMGLTTRVVGSDDHAMTEVTLVRGGRPQRLLLEPQHDLLSRECVLYSYPPR